MLLIITKKEDATADYVINKIIQRGIKFFRLNSDELYAGYVKLQIDNNFNKFIVTHNNSVVNLGSFQSAWLRRIAKPKLSIHNPKACEFAEQEWDFIMRWLVGALDCPVIDKEIDLIFGRNKIKQLQIASKIGFNIPKTLITNNPEEARKFLNGCHKTAIKALSGYGEKLSNGFEAVYTHIVTPDIKAKFNSIKYSPVILQEYIEKKFELRVTIVGKRVFACMIDSQSSSKTSVDWRRYGEEISHSEYKLDNKTTFDLLKMMKLFNVKFASFDLIITPKDEIVFLEMNPGSQFV